VEKRISFWQNETPNNVQDCTRFSSTLLKGVHDTFHKALRDADAAPLDRLLAEQFVWTDAEGMSGTNPVSSSNFGTASCVIRNSRLIWNRTLSTALLLS
jgi:hypothetical protein